MYKVIPGNTLLDAAVFSAGSAEDLFALAILNGLSFSADVAPGMQLQTTGLTYLPSTAPTNDNLTVKPVLVMPGQTLADMALQQLGSMEDFFALCNLNGLAYTDDLVSGQQLNYSLTPYDSTVVNLYAAKGYYPASATPGAPAKLKGIGYWYIQKDFKVS